MTAFIKEQVVYINDVEHRVLKQLDEVVHLENELTGAPVREEVDVLLSQYCEGTFKTARERHHELKKGFPPPTDGVEPPRLELVSEASRTETRRRIDYIVKLEAVHAFSGSRVALKAAIRDVSVMRKEARPPHCTTVYRWRRKFSRAQNDVRSLIARFDTRGGKNTPRLDQEVEAIVDDCIDSVFLAAKRGSAEDVRNAVLLEVGKANAQRTETTQLKVPSLRTIQRRLSSLYAFELAVARFGTKEAERRFAHHLGARRVSRILEMVEIDHTPVDLLVTDENRIVIGRPMLTVVIDRFSRCVLGYHLSLSGYGVPAVFEAIRHALLPKTYLSSRYADLNLEWFCYGWFERILMDNGTEFHAEAVADALTNLGIVAEFAAARDPNDKPHVERFLRTFNYSFIHRLPGTTLAKIHQRIGFKAEEDACVTLEELDRVIHVWICEVYHLRAHKGLAGRAPISVWKESAAAYPPALKLNAKDVDIEFSEVAECALQHYGIDLNKFVYVSARLLTLRRMLPQKARVTVKWPRSDVGYVFVWDPLDKEYFKVDNKDTEYAGLTLEQSKRARKVKAEGDPSYRQTAAEAGAVIRDEVAAAQADKKLSKRRAGARLANKSSKPLHRDPADSQGQPQEPSSQSDESDGDDELEIYDTESRVTATEVA